MSKRAKRTEVEHLEDLRYLRKQKRRASLSLLQRRTRRAKLRNQLGKKVQRGDEVTVTGIVPNPTASPLRWIPIGNGQKGRMEGGNNVR